MSKEEDKTRHSKRIQQKQNHVARQMSIRKAHHFPDDEAHRYHKISGVTCGDPNCFQCGNPRKFFKERTMQEKKFIESEKWDE